MLFICIDSPVNWMTRGTSNTSCSHLNESAEPGSPISRIHILRKHKRDQMAQVHAPATWPSSSIEIEWFAFFKKVKDAAELAAH